MSATEDMTCGGRADGRKSCLRIFRQVSLELIMTTAAVACYSRASSGFLYEMKDETIKSLI